MERRILVLPAARLLQLLLLCCCRLSSDNHMADAFAPLVPNTSRCQQTVLRQQQQQQRRPHVVLQSSKNSNESDNSSTDTTSFDQAAKDLVEEENEKRMAEMGDFDANPDSSKDSMLKMREATRARMAEMGLEKSQVSADYIASKQAAAQNAGSAQAAAEAAAGGDMFAGLDLSQISSVAKPTAASDSPWADENGEVPSMFYDPDEEMSDEEMAEADPLGDKPLVEQAIYELKGAKWPTPLAALKEVGVMIIIVIITGALIIQWDKVLRHTYTDVLGFIPTKADLAAYADRFSGLDLPSGWNENMSDEFVDKMGSAVDSTISSGMPDL